MPLAEMNSPKVYALGATFVKMRQFNLGIQFFQLHERVIIRQKRC
jgi:hypothetical protein